MRRKRNEVALKERREWVVQGVSAKHLDAYPSVTHSTPEARLAEDWEEMRADRDAHVSSELIAFIRENPDVAEVEEVLFRHLTRCSWCRNTIWESLNLSATPETHPLYALLKEAEEWQQENQVALKARERARSHQHQNGAALVFARDGLLLAEQPDGTVIELGKVREEATRR